MSSNVKTDPEIINNFEGCLEKYYHEEILSLAGEYPDQKILEVEWLDVKRHDPALAADVFEAPETVVESFHVALREYPVPIDIDMGNATVRLVGLPRERVHEPGSLRSEHAGEFLAIEGSLERVTGSSDRAINVVYVCARCPTQTEIPQDPMSDQLQQPTECGGCKRKGPFRVVDGGGEFEDVAKIRIASRATRNGDGKLVGEVTNELIDYGGEDGLVGRAGEPVTVNGIVRRKQRTGRGQDETLFDHYLDVHSVEFIRDEETVDIEKHREEFVELAAESDAVDKFARSIAPNLHTTDAWDAAMEFAVAYLFGAPRIDITHGPTYRGDLHFLIISDFGMGKSDFSSDVEAYSPKSIAKSTTALSSGVGLTAAAVEDDFGDGAWTIKPGLLVRANGGHLILDEIDKGPDELTDMNDALEGKQQVDVEKAGKSVTYDSKTAVMAMGNPIEGRFDQKQPVYQQLGISESLLSRFDGIVTMEDIADESQDKLIAETYGKGYTEAAEAEYGDREEFEQLDREVPIPVGRAWVQYARDNVNPLLTYEQFQTLEEWYAEDVRQLNKRFGEGGEAEDMPVPATVRVLGAAVKMAIAFARCRLQEEVQEQQIERAKKLAKRLVKQNWDGDRFDSTKNISKTASSQSERVHAIKDALDSPKSIEDVAEETGIDKRTVEERIEKLMNKGAVTEPVTGEYRII